MDLPEESTTRRTRKTAPPVGMGDPKTESGGEEVLLCLLVSYSFDGYGKGRSGRPADL